MIHNLAPDPVIPVGLLVALIIISFPLMALVWRGKAGSAMLNAAGILLVLAATGSVINVIVFVSTTG